MNLVFVVLFIVVSNSVVDARTLDDKNGASEKNNLRVRRVVGGTPSSRSDFPFMLRLKFRSQFICGANLIGHNIAVTAAHCVALSDKPDDYSVVVADHDISITDPWEHEITVKKVIVHEKFVLDAKQFAGEQNDIALLILERRVRPCTKNFTTVALPFKNVKSVSIFKNTATDPFNRRMYDECFIAGWGLCCDPLEKNTNKLQTSNVLMKAQLAPPMKPRKCNSIRGVTKKTNQGFFCSQTVFSKDGRDFDSGGPYVCKNKQTGVWTLLGLSSGSAGPLNVGIYTNVAEYVPWMMESITKMSLDPKLEQEFPKFWNSFQPCARFWDWKADSDRSISLKECAAGLASNTYNIFCPF